MRDELAQNGFEVGVHDLRHDGKLYWRRKDFPENARSINGYLQDWRASGFRSGFMLHDRECLNGLDIEYDASTFDTDPFEPQPEGVSTIFPFWVPRPGWRRLRGNALHAAAGFHVVPGVAGNIARNLEAKTRLDRPARRHGAASMFIPITWALAEESRGASEYPAAWYEEFLKYIRDHYAGQLLERPAARSRRLVSQNVCGTCRQRSGAKAAFKTESSAEIARNDSLRGKRAAVVLYSYYASDPRPRREAEALAPAGMDVDVICLRQDSREPGLEVLSGVRVHRVPLKRRRAGKMTYAIQYFSFLISSFMLLSWWRANRRYDLVHVHNMPDFLVFSALLPKLLGARVILDLHDPMPELLVTIFGLKDQSLGVRLLKFLEKRSVAFADHVLTVNQACKEIFSARSCRPGKIQVLMNVPDERVFRYRDCADYRERDPVKPFVVMYHGSIVERNGLDIAVEALRALRKNVPGAELWVYGATTPFLASVMDSVSQNGLRDAVRYLGPKTLDEIVTAIQTCDVGVIPNRNNAFTEINTPTRIFEYLSLGKPVISPRAKGITDYFGPDDMIYFQLGDPADLARQLEFVYRHPAEAQAVTARGQAVYKRECWSHARGKFLGAVGEMLSRNGTEVMISVLASKADEPVVREFFELFKTPWEFFRPNSRADVLLCTQNEIPANNAKLVLHYKSAAASPPRAPKVLLHEGKPLPIYVSDYSVEDSTSPVLSEKNFNSQTVVFVAYGLFAEVWHLLTDGQPPEHAASPTLERHIELLRHLILSHGLPLVEIPPRPAGHEFIACLTHDVDHVGIRNHKFDHTMFGFLYRATAGSVLEMARGKKSIGQLAANCLAATKLPLVHVGLAKDFWYQFDGYSKLENGVPSTFFVIPKKGEAGLDPNGECQPNRAASYDARDLTDILRGLEKGGKEIAVHGLNAWRDAAAGREEKEIISEIIGASREPPRAAAPPAGGSDQNGSAGATRGSTDRGQSRSAVGVRMHWLYFNAQSPTELEKAGFAYDSTCGYNGTIGYPRGNGAGFQAADHGTFARVADANHGYRIVLSVVSEFVAKAGGGKNSPADCQCRPIRRRADGELARPQHRSGTVVGRHLPLAAGGIQKTKRVVRHGVAGGGVVPKTARGEF